jgi:anti-sigma B factor antagonist
MDFSIDHRPAGDISVVEVKGWVEISTAPQLRDTAIRLIDEGRLHLVLDLSETVFIDSTGLGVIVGLLHRLRSRDGSLVIAGARDRVLHAFKVSKLTQVLTMTDTAEDAIAAINVGAASTAEPEPG